MHGTARQAENGWNNNAANFVACVSIRCKPCNLLALAILRPLKCWWCFRQDHYPWCSQSTYLVPVTDYGLLMVPFPNDIQNFWANWADWSNRFWHCESTKNIAFQIWPKYIPNITLSEKNVGSSHHASVVDGPSLSGSCMCLIGLSLNFAKSR